MSEESLEARTKDVRYIREHHTRKNSREVRRIHRQEVTMNQFMRLAKVVFTCCSVNLHKPLCLHVDYPVTSSPGRRPTFHLGPPSHSFDILSPYFFNQTQIWANFKKEIASDQFCFLLGTGWQTASVWKIFKKKKKKRTHSVYYPVFQTVCHPAWVWVFFFFFANGMAPFGMWVRSAAITCWDQKLSRMLCGNLVKEEEHLEKKKSFPKMKSDWSEAIVLVVALVVVVAVVWVTFCLLYGGPYWIMHQRRQERRRWRRRSTSAHPSATVLLTAFPLVWA